MSSTLEQEGQKSGGGMPPSLKSGGAIGPPGPPVPPPMDGTKYCMFQILLFWLRNGVKELKKE